MSSCQLFSNHCAEGEKTIYEEMWLKMKSRGPGVVLEIFFNKSIPLFNKELQLEYLSRQISNIQFNYIQSTLHIVNTICSSILFTITSMEAFHQNCSLYGEVHYIEYLLYGELTVFWNDNAVLEFWNIDSVCSLASCAEKNNEFFDSPRSFPRQTIAT